MGREYHGLLVLDKPTGITSRDAVNRIQKRLPRRTRIGHTGTLDPLATGVLVLCVGQATRLAEYVQEMDKIYRTTIVLGACSDTDDADGTIVAVPDATPIREETLRSAISTFVGDIAQRPPVFSAIKIDGQRAHQLARRGDAVDIAARTVSVYRIDCLRYEWPELDLEIHCGKGTYIRSLARDLGDKLGCGAYVKTLRRTRVGVFRTEDAISPDAAADEAFSRILPSATAVGHLPAVELNESQIAKLRQGQTIPDLASADAALCTVRDAHGGLIGIGRMKAGNLQSVKNL